MKLKRLKVKNVKSFRDEIEFNFHDDFNILIGPNGGGKSNLLDIVSIGLRYFLFNGYTYSESFDHYKRLVRSISAIPLDILSKKLQKCYGYFNDTSFVEVTLILEEQDIETIKIIQEHLDEIISVLKRTFRNGKQFSMSMTNLKRFNPKSIPIKNEIKFKFINNPSNNTSIPNFTETNIDRDAANFLHGFFKNYELFKIASNYIENFNIPTLLLFFTPYRNLEINSLSITLSNFNYPNEYQKLFTSSSKDTLNLTKIAITHFGEKMRDYEVKSKIDMWEEDKEVKLVSKYLNELGYGWNIKLIDKIKNTYEIELIKNGQVFPIDSASSGEREIINFLFGIFSINVKNGLIIIDEPELHLHPKWQKILLELFIELSELTGNQFIISTHSPVFINEHTYNHVFRIYKDNENVSRQATFKDNEEIKVKDLLHLINMTNNEKIYFADAVILVEGIKDRIVFQKILDKIIEKQNINKNIEIVEIRGKSNWRKFRIFLNELNIPNFFVGDLDVITSFEDSGEIKSLFITNLEKIYEDVIKNKKSMDGKKLVNQLEKAIRDCDCIELRKLWKYIKYIRKIVELNMLDEKDKKKIYEFIENKKHENIYILPKGEIENYLPNGHKKRLEKVIELLNQEENLNSWELTPEYKELENIINEIVQKIIK